MENPTPFDLNEAVRRWQQNLGASPAFCADDLEELASHLRVSVQRLTATGLSEEEAFQVAARRIGERGPLEREFAKLNPTVAWSSAVFVFWLAAGMFLLQVADSLVFTIVFLHDRFWYFLLRTPDGFPPLAQMYARFGSPYLSPDFRLTWAIVMVLVFILCARLTVGEWKRFNRFIRRFEHPFRAALGLAVPGLVPILLPAFISAFRPGWPYGFAWGKVQIIQPGLRVEGGGFWPHYVFQAAVNAVLVITMVFLARRALRNNAAGKGPATSHSQC
jgi:hypothetical protein